MSTDRIRKRSPKRSFALVSDSISNHSHPVARCKTSSGAHAPPPPSETSSASVSDEHPSLSEATHPSTTDTQYSSSEDDSSELSESSDEPSSDSDGSDEEEREHYIPSDHCNVEEEDIATIIPLDKRKTKPKMRLYHEERQSGALLRHRLKEFIPQMAAANEVLEKEREEGLLDQRNIELVNESDEESYIEMNLGLGVLEEQQHGSQDGSEDECRDDKDEAGNSNTPGFTKEKDVLGKLLGRDRPEEVGIEVLEDR